MFVTQAIAHWARTNPNQLAILTKERVITYASFHKAICSAISSLDEVLRGDKTTKVAVWINSPAESLVVTLSLMHLGYQPHLINASVGQFGKEYGFAFCITDQKRNIHGVADILVSPDWFDRNSEFTSPAKNPGATFYSSGSTGKPKPTLKTFEGSPSPIGHFIYSSAFVPYRKRLVLMGVISTFGFHNIYESFIAGQTTCFTPDITLAPFLINIHDIDFIVCSVQQCAALVKEIEANPIPSGKIQAVMLGGSKIPPTLLTKVRERLCRKVMSSYGATEAGTPALATDLIEIEHIEDAVGYILPWANLEIVDEADCPVANGLRGIVRYYIPKSPLEEYAASRDIPWYYPGDIGSIVNGSVLCIHGRVDHVMNIGGVKFSAEDIDFELSKIDICEEVAVTTRESSEGHDLLSIFVVSHHEKSLVEARIELQLETLSIKSLPFSIHFIDKLPRSSEGKLLRGRLLESAEPRPAR